jgi:ATP-binding cassette subfamily B multidrug efflux pump
MLRWPNISARYGTMPMLRMRKEAVEAKPLQKPKVRNASATLSKIAAYVLRSKRLLLVVLGLILVSSLLSLLGPYLLGLAVQTYLVNRTESGLFSLLIFIAGAYVLQTVTVLLQHYFMIGVAQRTVADMRKDLFSRLHKMRLASYAGRKNGDLMSRLTNDIDNVSQTLSGSFLQVTSSLITFIGMLILMFWLNALLTVISLTVIPFMFLAVRWVTARTGKLFKDQQREMGAFSGFVEETLSGQLVVKAFAREQGALSMFGRLNRQLATSSYWAQTYSGFMPKIFFVLNNMSFAVIATAGSMLALKGIVTIGLIVTFTEYARQFVRPLNDLSSQINTMFSALAGAERAFELMDGDEEQDDPDAVKLGEAQGEIEFRHVSFAYRPDELTLSDLHFRIRPGETAALVGPTGAGKSTIAQLIARFYDVTEGSIHIDGKDIRKIERSSLRQHMGLVLQDSILFEMTIRENIRYGRLDATDAEVEQAAKDANAHSFIMKLPNGYDTVLQQGGEISHGQKQLLSIARTIIADPSILILDEATSSIDTVTELKIQEALQRLMKGRTNLVIAHRLNTIRNANLILVLDQGRTVEQGTHEELLEKQGHYYNLYVTPHQNEQVILP